MSEITIKHLAKMLNLAPSTVSRALNDSYEISQATKDKVQALADSLHYQPNPFAKSLRAQKSKTIAVIIPERINNYFAQVIEGIESVTQDQGYHLLVYSTHESLETERRIVSYLLNGRVDAIVMSVSSQTSEIDHLLNIYQNKIPIIFFDRICKDIPTAKFITNNYESGYQATKHLIGKGCKKIYFLLLSKDISIGLERLLGYWEAIRDGGLDFEESWVVQCSQNEDKNRTLIKNFLYGMDRPDGIIASVEKLAIATYQTAKEMRLHMPKDFKMISFSNMRIAGLLNPPLSTISQPAIQLGSECAKLLMQSLKKPNQQPLEDRVVVIPSKMELRESSGD